MCIRHLNDTMCTFMHVNVCMGGLASVRIYIHTCMIASSNYVYAALHIYAYLCINVETYRPGCKTELEYDSNTLALVSNSCKDCTACQRQRNDHVDVL